MSGDYHVFCRRIPWGATSQRNSSIASWEDWEGRIRHGIENQASKISMIFEILVKTDMRVNVTIRRNQNQSRCFEVARQLKTNRGYSTSIVTFTVAVNITIQSTRYVDVHGMACLPVIQRANPIGWCLFIITEWNCELLMKRC